MWVDGPKETWQVHECNTAIVVWEQPLDCSCRVALRHVHDTLAAAVEHNVCIASYLFMQHTSILFSETIWNSNVWYSMVFELSCSPTGSNEHQKLNLIMEHRYDPSGSYWMIMLSCFASILIAFHCGIFWADWSDFFSRLYSIVWVEFGYKPLVSYTGSRAGQWVHDR